MYVGCGGARGSGAPDQMPRQGMQVPTWSGMFGHQPQKKTVVTAGRAGSLCVC